MIEKITAGFASTGNPLEITDPENASNRFYRVNVRIVE